MLFLGNFGFGLESFFERHGGGCVHMGVNNAEFKILIY